MRVALSMFAALSLARAGFSLDVDAKIAQVQELNSRYVQAVMAPKSAGIADEVKYRLVRDLDASCLQLVLDMMSRFRGDLDAVKAATKGVIEWWGWPPRVSEEDWVGQFKHQSLGIRGMYREVPTKGGRFFFFETTYPRSRARGCRPTFGMRCLQVRAATQELRSVVPSLPLRRDDWSAIQRDYVALLGVAQRTESDLPVVICTYGRTGSGAFLRHHTLRYDADSQTWKATYPIGETSSVRTWSYDEETLAFSIQVGRRNKGEKRTRVTSEIIDLKRFGYTPFTPDIEVRGQRTHENDPPLQPDKTAHRAQGLPDSTMAPAAGASASNAATAWPHVVMCVAASLAVAAASAWLLLRRRRKASRESH